jgi:hypothetical protein
MIRDIVINFDKIFASLEITIKYYKLQIDMIYKCIIIYEINKKNFI